MRFTIAWLTVLLLAVASADESEDLRSVSREETEGTTENGQQTSLSNNKTAFSNNDMPNKIRIEKLSQNDGKDHSPNRDVTMVDLLFYESLIDGDKIMEENDQRNSVSRRDDNNERSDKIDSNFENPIESKISADLIDIRRQGELKPTVKFGKSGQDVQFDDSKQEVVINSSPRFGQRKSKQKTQEETPVLQLTQGGYDRPYKRHRFRNRHVPRPDSSEQSSEVQELDRNSNGNRPPEATRFIPQVRYSSSLQRPHAFRPQPILNPGFEAPRNMLTVPHVGPTTIQSAFFNTPSPGLTDYTTLPFQSHFSQSNEVGGFPNFGSDPNNGALYQASQRNPFQTPGVLFQSAPEVQSQPIIIDPARNIPPQFQQNTFTAYPGFENAEDNSRSNYEMYFRNPTANSQFQVPSNFYLTTPNEVNAFNSPPISFLSNYPNSDEKLPSRFFRYPVTTDVQNNRQSSTDQEPESDSSQEGKNTKVGEQEATNPENRDDSPTASFGARLQAQNEAEVYMRYPTNEAGYAIEENLPSRNNSDEVKENNQETNSKQKIFSSADPFRNVLNSFRPNQKINNSFDFSPELFRSVPMDFGYQRPQAQIFVQYPDRNQGMPRYQSPSFESRGPFEPIASLPENNYQFLHVDNSRRGHREPDGTPSCAKQNNASVCFEDSEYPKNEILYSLSSNAFLANRLFGREMLLNSAVFVERNATDSDETLEKYACAVNTKYGSPLRAKNLEGAWRIIVNMQGKFSQPVRIEACKSLGDPCSYVDSRTKTTCVQKYSLQRLLSWNPNIGIYSDVYKIPVACSCQILKAVET